MLRKTLQRTPCYWRPLVIRVLVVDDSPTMRELLVRLLQADGGFELAGVACDGEEAADLTRQLRPDVITMDIHMPRLDGVAATRRIMAETPTPIVVVAASIRTREVDLAFRALQAGAVTVVNKPPGPNDPDHARAVGTLLNTVRLMSAVKVVRQRRLTTAEAGTVQAPLRPNAQARGAASPLAVAIAASTGGPQAIQAVLQALGSDLGVPVLVVQHIGQGFAAGMAAWLATTCPQVVKLAEQGEVPVGGTVYLAPEDSHLLVTHRGSLALSQAPRRGSFRPSADVLFESASEVYGARVVGVILTGMGDDGVAGLRLLRAAGAPTIAQDEATSVVYGMPRAAVEAGAAGQVLPLSAIGPGIRWLLETSGA
ncbi:MAG: chemotaxis-specific protein-glutamate methyltransferase CheB [Chloroflexota bacterium]